MLLTDVLSLIAATHGIFLAFLLKRFSGSAPNNLLVALLVAISLCLCVDLWVMTPLVYEYPQLAQILTPVYFMIGPLLFLYIKGILGRNSVFNVFHLLHFLPTIIFYALIIVIDLIGSTEDLRKYLIADREATSIDGFGVAIQVQVGIYLCCSVMLWRRFEKAVKKEYSSDIILTMNWLRQALIIFCAMWLVWVLGDFLNSSLVVLSDFAMMVGVYFLGYSALLHKNILLPALSLARLDDDHKRQPLLKTLTSTGSNRYARAKLTESRTAQLKHELHTVFTRDHPYLEPELTLTQLAELLSATPHELSQLLNEELGESFFEYINRHRVIEVQRCLHDAAYGQQTILDIALASGFNSKASFNAAFKKVTGMTPTQYRTNQI